MASVTLQVLDQMGDSCVTLIELAAPSRWVPTRGSHDIAAPVKLVEPSQVDVAPAVSHQGRLAVALRSMDYVNLGTTGLRVSRLVLGMMSFGKDPGRQWALDEDGAEPIVRRAVEGGITFFDTADVYNGGQSEVVTGHLLPKLFGMREEYVVATKVFFETMPGENGRGLSRKHVLASIDASLERLGLDYVDLYQIHRWDPLTPIEETMEALHDVVKAGKARYLGASSMYAWQFAKAQRVAPTPFVSMQNHYNLVYREEEREMIPQCVDQGVGVLPWSPLARGLLAGNRTREGERLTTRARTDEFGESLYTPEVDFAVVDRAEEVASVRGVTSAQVALAWLLHKPAVTAPIVGATKVEHIEDAIRAEGLSLSEDEITRLEEPYMPHAISGH
jgi:1-deoxyxylulose-5-phosphate synthase